MPALELVIPSKFCGTWGPTEKPKELEESLTDEEYQTMRHIMHSYRKAGSVTALGISLGLSVIFLVHSIVNDDYSTMGHTWCVGIPWALCPATAMVRAKATINAQLLNPRGASLRCGFFADKIVHVGPVDNPIHVVADGSPRAQSMPEAVVSEEKTRLDSVLGRRERERVPANYGIVELSHSSKHDVAADVVRSMYTHLSDGTARSERIIACNMKIVYAPEEDLSELVQVYNSNQMRGLRVESKNVDGARRVLRFFANDGSSLAVGLE